MALCHSITLQAGETLRKGDHKEVRFAAKTVSLLLHGQIIR
jgi:hypothetical protein